MRDREAALEVCQAVGTSAALLSLAWAAIELAFGVDLLGIAVFAVLTAIAIVAVLMIIALQRGWFRAYFDKTSSEDLVGYSFQAMGQTTTTETLALHLMHRLYEATDGWPNPWRMLAGLQFTQPALDLAVERGWLIVDEGVRSVCLTEAGRERVRRWRDEAE